MSAVMRRLPCTISLTRRGGTPMATASRFWLTSSGARNSSIRTSPGWMGAMVLIRATSSVVVDDLDVGGPASVQVEQIRHCWLIRMLC